MVIFVLEHLESAFGEDGKQMIFSDGIIILHSAFLQASSGLFKTRLDSNTWLRGLVG